MTKSKAEQVRDWFEKAGSDLKVARREMAAPDPVRDAVCFHFQQAVEKLLKAWLIWSDVDFDPIHNIAVILAACEKTDLAFGQLKGAAALTPYAVSVRYGDDFYIPTALETAAASAVASEVETFLLSKFASVGFDPRRGTGQPTKPEDAPPGG